MSKCGGVHCPGCGDGGTPVLLIIGAVLFLSAAGAVAAVSADLFDALWAAFAVTAATVAATGAGVVYRARHPAVATWNPSPEGSVRTPAVRSTVRYELPDPQRAAIGQAVPRELHQHVHYHYGAEPPREEILRRSQRPEQ